MTVIANEWESLAEAASRMRFNDVGSAAVITDGSLVGILTERDLARAIADGADPRRVTVADYMSPDPTVIEVDAEARDAARVMADAGFRHLPVVSEGAFVGLISMRDLLTELVWSPQGI
jgi:CBS domain-containing protein